jgi:uncharacterized protein (TIGR03435 family)
MRNNPGDSFRRTAHSKSWNLLIGWPAIFLALAVCAIAAPLRPSRAFARQSSAQTSNQTQSRESTAAATPTRSPSAAAADFEYEVASFKSNKSGNGDSGWSNGGDSLTGTNVPLQSLIDAAYGIRDSQLFGAPEWLSAERYDINAKMSGETAAALRGLSPDERNLALQGMMQRLFAERLKLTARHDSRELPVYLLLVTKKGSKLTEAKPEERSTTNTSAGSAGMTIKAQAMTMDGLAMRLSGRAGRIVLNKTDLSGKFDFTLSWADERPIQPASSDAAVPAAPDPTGPSIFTALQEQLGLKLESSKAPVPVIVIEHVERPSDN